MNKESEMGEVKRYDAVHIRYEDRNIRYGEGCEVEMVTARDYDALCAELAALKAKTAVPEKYKMQPYQTVDKGSTNYKAGWNACINAMLAAAPAQPQSDAVPAEAVEVVAYRISHPLGNWKVYEKKQDWAYKSWWALTYEVQDLMTVAQHQRILAAQTGSAKGVSDETMSML